ncbi:N,N-dimethylformamidase large subunit [Paeniroseomonas aquatica]|uniref:N,N-dimethylformamidase large subunit n=1 Tax=Paeniroseomonas aquatica TaxID=373043 RepID=A0ABT8ADA2_9PROT|nr:N,N-dimethylformamidase beta subunit family domain-containing protein [Paeniroseomonas aquatica]MDN3567729.1 N,N-dimethylformamidase large subunit [Paeniroseomonas aquatica]
MLPLIGYLDRFSGRPGESLAVKVSAAMPYAADIVRIRHADPNPAGPGMRLLPVASACAGAYPARVQAVPLGSSGHAGGALELGRGFTLLLRLQPWLLRGQVVALEVGGHALALTLGAAGLVATADGVACALAAAPHPRRWYEVAVTLGEGRLRLAQRALQPVAGRPDEGTAEAALPAADWSGTATLTFGAGFNGRIEDPMLLAGTDPATLDDPEALLAAGRVRAWWDFSIGIGGDGITDRGPAALHGTLRNLPTRAMRGSRWTGTEHAWRHAPRHYAAIHFHEDDLADCGWETAFTVPIPADMPSGVYGVRLRGADGAATAEDIIPFYVLPPKGTVRAPIAFLASTFTYQVYANHQRGNLDDAFRRRIAEWGAYPHSPDEHSEFAHSTYNTHPDGSGIGFSTRLRPILTMRPGFLTFDDARGSGLRHFPADSHITDWLEAKGIAFDVITDEDLDAEGLPLLAGYKAVVTGAHPEYHSQVMLDALQNYVGGGGRLAYLGGNGFYWKVARRADLPGVIELRRAEGGIRAWAADPGEYYHQFDGTMGGLWRRNGRPPQQLCGVGFSGQGAFEGSHYRRLPAAGDPRVAWIMAGVEGDILGDFGLSGGGAAGFELDRADPLLGTPPGAVILARSEQHQSHFVTVPEELLGRITTIPGEDAGALIRAEIVYFDTPGGGAVFSTGSITFAGSLSHNGYANPISRMLENVLRRFGA